MEAAALALSDVLRRQADAWGGETVVELGFDAGEVGHLLVGLTWLRIGP